MTSYAIPYNADPMNYLKNIANNYWKDISFCDKSGCPAQINTTKIKIALQLNGYIAKQDIIGFILNVWG